MSDAGAPAAAPAPLGPQGTQNATGSTATKGATKSVQNEQTGQDVGKVTESDWNDENEKQFFELAKRAPWAKTKHKGEEKSIDSKETFLEVLNEAQRAKGASKMVEQAKKEREEAAKEREEARRVTSLLARAREGDEEARRALFGESPDETAKREQEWQQLTPQMRQLLVERQQMAEQLEQFQAQQQASLQEQQERARVQQLEQRRASTMKFVDQLLPELGVSPENGEALLGVTAEAIESLGREGLEVSELTPALVRQRMAQLQDHLRADHFKKLSWETRIGLLGEDVEALTDAQLEKVPLKWRQRVSKYEANRLRGIKSQPPQAQQQVTQEPQRRDEGPPEVLPLSRWRR